MDPSTTPTGTAAELGRRYLDRLAARDPDGILALLADSAVTELPFAPGRMRSEFGSAAEYAPFIRRVFTDSLAEVVVSDVVVSEVGAERAFLEFRSDCRTSTGQDYRNRYVVRVDAADGRITRWREYYDPTALLELRGAAR